MDTKRSSRSRRRRRVPRQPVSPGMIYDTSWTQTSVTSGTTGTMASWTDGSIVHSSEYSVISSLFTEVKCLSIVYYFSPTQSANGTVLHGSVLFGTNMAENAATGTNPTAFSDVQNLQKTTRMLTASTTVRRYQQALPRNLEFSLISADSPNPPTPWAGTPGVVKWYGVGFTPSTVYFNLQIQARYFLRGRQ